MWRELELKTKSPSKLTVHLIYIIDASSFPCRKSSSVCDAISHKWEMSFLALPRPYKKYFWNCGHLTSHAEKVKFPWCTPIRLLSSLLVRFSNKTVIANATGVHVAVKVMYPEHHAYCFIKIYAPLYCRDSSSRPSRGATASYFLRWRINGSWHCKKSNKNWI